MNDELLTTDDQRLLDRLVDGELTETERRNLLLRLERAPDGWRRCALAFLEAQAWRSEARSLVREPAVRAAADIVPASLAARRRNTPWLPYALAASLLLAIGTWVTVRDQADRNAPVFRPAGGAAVAGNTPQNLRLVVDGGPNESQQVVDVPLVEAERMNDALFGPSQTLSPDMVRLLEQAGHQVVRERHLVPVDLRDGRRVVVPMDQVEIRPVGLQNFQ